MAKPDETVQRVALAHGSLARQMEGARRLFAIEQLANDGRTVRHDIVRGHCLDQGFGLDVW